MAEREMTDGARKLEAWKKRHGHTYAQLDELLGAAPGGNNAWRLAKGHYRPGFDAMERIARLTGGAVLPNDWMSDKVRSELKL